MQILLNGQATETLDGITITQLLESIGMQGQRIAVEVNLDIVPRSMHAKHELKPGDRIEIVHALGGG